MNSTIQIAPSILSADILHLADELEAVKTADMIHFDVMDGHYVPNLTFGPSVVRAVKQGTELPVDVHLMITNPDSMVDLYADAGADSISFHMESALHAHRIVQQIHKRGIKAAIALNPATPVSILDCILDELDMVLLMTVNPGFGGQAFIESSIRKIKQLRRMCDERGVNPLIQVDGGIALDTIAEVTRAGARCFVAGSALFGAENRAEAIRNLKAQAELELMQKC